MVYTRGLQKTVRTVSYGEPPAELTPFYVWVDPCLYMQQNGGCNATPFSFAGWVVDSTGKVVPVDVSALDSLIYGWDLPDFCPGEVTDEEGILCFFREWSCRS